MEVVRYLNKLVLAGCDHELKSVHTSLRMSSPMTERVAAVYRRALSPQHAAMIPDHHRSPRSRFLVFEKLLPPPIEISNTDESDTDILIAWRKACWGTPYPRTHVGQVSRDEEGRVFYRFFTDESPPLPWVRFLSSVFPTLGVALHYYDSRFTVYCSVTFRGGRQVHDFDYSHPDFSELFLNKHFDWRLEAGVDLGRLNRIIEVESPVVGITNEVIASIQDSDSTDSLQQIRDQLLDLGLSLAEAYTLIARYAPDIPETILAELLEHPPAPIALALRPSVSKRLATLATRMTLQRLATTAVPAQFHLKSGWESDTRFDWPQQIQGWRRLLVRCIEDHKLLLDETSVKLAFRRYQELDPDDETECIVRNALAEALVRSPATPPHVLEALRPTRYSLFADLIAAHPNASPRLCADLASRFSLGFDTQATIALNPRLSSDPGVVRALLRQDYTPDLSFDYSSGVHAFTLCALAVLGPISELPRIFEKIEDEPDMLFKIIETLPPERKSLVPSQIWSKLLQSDRRDVRERAITLLGSAALDRNRLGFRLLAKGR